VVRPDILIRKDSRSYIIEVKSKVGNLRQHREGKMLINMHGDVRAAYKEVGCDLAFQVEVLRQAFPNLMIVPYFLLPEETSLAQEAEVKAVRGEEQIVVSKLDRDTINRWRSDSALKFFPAHKAIERIKVATAATMTAMAKAWQSEKRPGPLLKYRCRNCELRLKGAVGKNDDHGIRTAIPSARRLRRDAGVSRDDKWKRGRLPENEGSHRHFAPQLRHPRQRQPVDHL